MKCPKCNNDIKVKQKFTENGLTIVECLCNKCGYVKVESLSYQESKIRSDKKYHMTRSSSSYR